MFSGVPVDRDLCRDPELDPLPDPDEPGVHRARRSPVAAAVQAGLHRRLDDENHAVQRPGQSQVLHVGLEVKQAVLDCDGPRRGSSDCEVSSVRPVSVFKRVSMTGSAGSLQASPVTANGLSRLALTGAIAEAFSEKERGRYGREIFAHPAVPGPADLIRKPEGQDRLVLLARVATGIWRSPPCFRSPLLSVPRPLSVWYRSFDRDPEIGSDPLGIVGIKRTMPLTACPASSRSLPAFRQKRELVRRRRVVDLECGRERNACRRCCDRRPVPAGEASAANRTRQTRVRAVPS